MVHDIEAALAARPFADRLGEHLARAPTAARGEGRRRLVVGGLSCLLATGSIAAYVPGLRRFAVTEPGR